MENVCICGAVDDPEKGQGHNHGPTRGMDFGHALFWLKKGQPVTRAGSGKRLFFMPVIPDSALQAGPCCAFCQRDYWESCLPGCIVGYINTACPPIDRPYIYVKENGEITNFGCMLSHTDMLAEDWELAA